MSIVKEYMSEILFRTKRRLPEYILTLLGIVVITTITAFIGMKIIGVENAFLKSLLLGVFSALPIVGSGFVIIPWIIVRLITKDPGLAGQLAIVYIILVMVKQGLTPYLNGSKYGIRPIITFVVFIVFYIFGRLTGAYIASFVILLITTTFEVLDIQNTVRNYKRRNRRKLENRQKY